MPDNAESSDRLKEAIQRADLETLKCLLESGVDPNAADAAGATPLYWALFVRNVPAVRCLLEAGADSDKPPCPGIGTALEWETCCIVFDGNTDPLRLLLQVGANPNPIDAWGHSVLHREAQRSKDVFHEAFDGFTIAIKVCRLLLEKGADVDCGDYRGLTPLVYAAHKGNLELVRLFLEAGANPNDISDDRTPQNSTALLYAFFGGNQKIVDLLYKHGATMPPFAEGFGLHEGCFAPSAPTAEEAQFHALRRKILTTARAQQVR
jgi:ankyrin repeat protein